MRTSLDAAEISEVVISGETYRMMSASLEQNGVSVSQYICARKVDGYMIEIVFSSLGSTSFDQMLGYFS